MAEYRLTIERDGNPIFDNNLEADAVIEIMRSIAAAGGAVSHSTNVDPSESKGGKIRRCGKCGGAGHTVRTCGIKKKSQ